MAIVNHVFRDKTEATTPPTVDHVTPIEGGILARHDDVADDVQYCPYILIRSDATGGTYTEKWRIQAPDRSAIDSLELVPRHTLTANETELVFLPVRSAAIQTTITYNLGNKPDPTDAEIIAAFSNFVGSVPSRFSAKVARSVFNSDVAGLHIQAEF